MTKEIFVDAGAWIALSDQRDKYHARARQAYQKLAKHFPLWTTTNLMLAEAHIMIRKHGGHQPALHFLEQVQQSDYVLVFYADAQLEGEALAILRQYADQDFSYADAVSFALMRQRGITDAFAFDHHFTTAGFSLLPNKT